MKEFWKEILNYEGLYWISNLGNVKSNKKILKVNIGANGYARVNLRKSGVTIPTNTHRLVAQAFLPNPLNKSQVNHIDSIRSNNVSTNLEWCTPAENQQHSYLTTNRQGNCLGKFGKAHHTSKAVAQVGLDNQIITIFGSSREASRKTGVSQGNISSCCTGHRKKAGGYYWKHHSK